MLMPKRVKYRKLQRGRLKGKAYRGNSVAFGTYGLQSLEGHYVTSRQIEAARRAIVRYVRRGGKIWMWFPFTKQPGEVFETIVTYGGSPRVAPRAPWIGGIMWAKTPTGADWVSVALQNDGAVGRGVEFVREHVAVRVRTRHRDLHRAVGGDRRRARGTRRLGVDQYRDRAVVGGDPAVEARVDVCVAPVEPGVGRERELGAVGRRRTQAA